ncbi:MAG: glycosyltransferase family 9 protein [Deltaproteobacteria bacterium]|nr:glycosyltransferase family 9 protein [Deltaproteobacteria bacterium]
MTDTFHPIRDAKNVLVIQLGDIGDVVLATPSLRALKETLPEARVSVLVRKGYGSLLEADPYLHEVIEVAKSRGKIAELCGENIRLVRRLRRAEYDLAIDLRTGDRGAILAFLTGAPVRVSRYDREKSFWRNGIFNHPIYSAKPASPPAHPGADQSLSLLRAIGIDTEDTAPRLWTANAATGKVRALLFAENVGEGGRWVTINPFSRWKYKEWGYDRWGEVIGWLWKEHGIRSVLVGSREERDAAARIAEKCGGGACNLAGETTLAELAALLRLATMHLGVDSAAPHIASAVGTPSVTIFGPSDWRAWTVPSYTRRIVTPERECVPCRRKGCDGKERSICLEEMETEPMKSAIREVLKVLEDRVSPRQADLP